MPKRKVSFKELLGIKTLESLTPPRAPRILTQEQEDFIQEKIFEDAEVDYGNKTFERAIVSETSVSGEEGLSSYTNPKGEADSTPAIDFEAMAKASEFQRFVYWILTGETFRGSTKALRMKINHVKQKINMVQSMPPEVMRELKEVLRKRNEKD